MFKNIFIFIVIFFVVTAIFAAGLPESSKDELRPVVVVLDWVPNTNHIGAYVADALGYFIDEGLKVEIIQPAESSAEVLVALGRADFGYSYQESVTFARTSDDALPVVAIAAVIQHNTSGFASPKELRTVSDLVGMTYGGWGSPVEIVMLQTLLEDGGASLDDIRIINTGTADFFSLIEREIDVSWVFQGWTMVEARLRGKDLFYIDLAETNEIFDYYTPTIITNEKHLDEERNLVKSFMRALSRGYEYAVFNPEKAADLLVEAVPEISLDLARASLVFLADEFIADAERWGEMKTSVWKRYADWLFEHGLISRRLDVEMSFSNEFLP